MIEKQNDSAEISKPINDKQTSSKSANVAPNQRPSGVDPRTNGIDHKGSEELAHKYNTDEQAHLDSGEDDFYKTTSNFRHSDGSAHSTGDNL